MAVHKLSISLDRDFPRVAPPTVDRVAQDPCLHHLRKMSAQDLESLVYCILRHYASWAEGDVRQIGACVRLLGNVCFVRSLPLFEVSVLLYAIRDVIVDDMRMESLRAGAEPDESDLNASRFFDLVAFELLKGY